MQRNTVSRTMHDLGLAAWFGGTLANAVALNVAAGAADDPQERNEVANTGWDRWTPVNAAAIGVHLIGSVGQLIGNRARVADQADVAVMSAIKTVLTAAALGATAWSRALGQKMRADSDAPIHDATTPTDRTPSDVAAAARQLNSLQWAVPALTGALIAVSSFAGEQQRASSVAAAVRSRLGR